MFANIRIGAVFFNCAYTLLYFFYNFSTTLQKLIYICRNY